MLVPDRAAGTVVIRDNLATHMNAEAARAMRDAGRWSSPCSLNLDPIEMARSKLKAHLRRIGARTFTDMFDAIAEICDLYSPQECWNYFEAAGYVSGDPYELQGSPLRRQDRKRSRGFCLLKGTATDLPASLKGAIPKNSQALPAGFWGRDLGQAKSGHP